MRRPRGYFDYAGQVIIRLRSYSFPWKDISDIWGARISTLENAMVRMRGGWRDMDQIEPWRNHARKLRNPTR